MSRVLQRRPYSGKKKPMTARFHGEFLNELDELRREFGFKGRAELIEKLCHYAITEHRKDERSVNLAEHDN